jgi:hypothetical protein
MTFEKFQTQKTQKIVTSNQKLCPSYVETQCRNRNFKKKEGKMTPLKVNTSTTNNLNDSEEERS